VPEVLGRAKVSAGSQLGCCCAFGGGVCTGRGVEKLILGCRYDRSEKDSNWLPGGT
jgi:hypothetical protein